MYRLYKSIQYLLYPDYIRDVHVESDTMVFLVHGRIGRSWYGNTDGLSNEGQYLRTLVQPGERIIECGAHHGFYSVWMARWTGIDGSVLAFDPNLENFGVLSTQIQLNSLRNITAIPIAMSSHDGTVLMTKRSNSEIIEGRSHRGISVKSTTLDALADFKPTLIKLDVEGHELNCLRHATQILHTTPKLAIEIHFQALRRLGERVEELAEVIDGSRYRSFITTTQQPAREIEKPSDVQDFAEEEQVHLFCVPKGRAQ